MNKLNLYKKCHYFVADVYPLLSKPHSPGIYDHKSSGCKILQLTYLFVVILPEPLFSYGIRTILSFMEVLAESVNLLPGNSFHSAQPSKNSLRNAVFFVISVDFPRFVRIVFYVFAIFVKVRYVCASVKKFFSCLNRTNIPHADKIREALILLASR